MSFASGAALVGSVRSVFECVAMLAMLTILRTELPLVCKSYLLAAAKRANRLVGCS